MAKMTREQCVKAAMKAGAATEATANRIVDDLLKEAAALRQQGMTSAKDLSAAWDRRMDAELRKAVRERRLADLHIIRRSQFAEHVDAIRGGNPDLKFEDVILAALQGEGKPTPGGRASVASYLAGVQRDTIVPMLRALHEMNDGLTLERFARDRDFEMTVVRELYGEKTGDAEAAQVAKVVADTLEEARQRFNATGGDMGRLSGGWAPQTHDRRKVAQAVPGEDPRQVDGVIELRHEARLAELPDLPRGDGEEPLRVDRREDAVFLEKGLPCAVGVQISPHRSFSPPPRPRRRVRRPRS